MESPGRLQRKRRFARTVGRGGAFPDAPVSLLDRFLSGPFHRLYYRFYITDKGFKAYSMCTSCGKCAERRPLSNIDMAAGRPVWKGTCTHCMACLCGCPAEAIEFRSVSKGKRRYCIMQE